MFSPIFGCDKPKPPCFFVVFGLKSYPILPEKAEQYGYLLFRCFLASFVKFGDTGSSICANATMECDVFRLP